MLEGAAAKIANALQAFQAAILAKPKDLVLHAMGKWDAGCWQVAQGVPWKNILHDGATWDEVQQEDKTCFWSRPETDYHTGGSP